MRIVVNNQIYEFAESPSAMALIVKLFPGGDYNGIALAVNQEVVPKQKWAAYIITENDHVDLIRATQGG